MSKEKTKQQLTKKQIQKLNLAIVVLAKLTIKLAEEVEFKTTLRCLDEAVERLVKAVEAYGSKDSKSFKEKR